MLPTWGTGLLVFVMIAYWFSWVNRIALFASVIVFNPVVKWGVYAASFTLGFLLLGAVDPTTGTSTETAAALVMRLLVGNLIIAVVMTILSYVGAYWLVTRYRTSAGSVVDIVLDEFDEPPA